MTLSAPTDRNRRWVLGEPAGAAVERLVRELGVTPLVAQLCVNRGFADAGAAREHLEPRLERLHDPRLFADMERATARLMHAIERKETILVHGDYDVDGVTGTVLLVRLLRHLGASVAWHIPDRFRDGYSFGEHSLRRAAEVDAKLVVSVDNGTSAAETIAALRARGVDTIVTDHHEPPRGPLPPAVAILNPKLDDARYPFRELCGGAVAFKLAWGLCQAVTGETRVRADLREYLVDAMAYVAIATVCDVVPLVGENRILAHYGLKALERARPCGVRALLEVAGLRGRPLCAEDVGFQIGPRLNASGRLENAARAVEVLLADDIEEARRLARALDEQNNARKEIERTLVAAALEAARPFADAERWPVTVVAGQGWHQGVVGIAAARLASRLRRPALVIGLDGEAGRGSARSVKGFDVLAAMHAAAPHFARYGGHAQAAGCEVLASAVDAAREAICARARELLAAAPRAEHGLAIDLELDFAAIDPGLMHALAVLEPFGEKNEKPLFLTRGLFLAEPPRVVGKDGEHLILRLRRGEHVLKALAFGAAERGAELARARTFDVVHTPRWNHFRGERTLELVVADFLPGA